MDAIRNHDALLYQLQSQINLVLEHTGKVFAAVNTNPKTSPTAQVNRLKQILPVAQSRFHEALDQLETDLQLAQLVLRRDLAHCREREGIRIQTVTREFPIHSHSPGPRASTTITKDEQPATSDDNVHSSEEAPNDPDRDVTMQDSTESDLQADEQMPDQPPLQEAQPECLKVDSPESPAPIEQAPEKPPSEPQVQAQPEPETRDQAPPDPPEAPVAATDDNHKEGADSKVPDVPAKEKPTEEKAPTVAKDTNNNPADLDSLFSGTGSGGDNPFDFGDQNTSGNIDFGDFGAGFGTGDNDSISSLLPGLEDYANTQSNNSGAELDLNTFFNTGTDNNQNPAPTNNQAPAEQQQRDTTFDDLMDLANFDGAGMDDGNNNTDLDFDSLFN